MDKKIITTILVIVIAIILIILYINIRKNRTLNETENEEVISNDLQNNMIESNVLVLYFSATNNTKAIAEYISQITGGELIEIIPEEEYTSEDLNYNNSSSRANLEQNDDNARPRISNTDIDISKYDIIYLGYPIWWGDVPKIILTLLDTYDFTGKTVIPFCTSGSTGIATSVNTLKNYDSTVNWENGMRFSSSSTKKDVEEWISQI